jgi:hypothetical protein
VKKYLVLTALVLIGFLGHAQERGGNRRDEKAQRKDEKRQRTNAIIRQEEEGVLSYNKHTAFGVELRSNGYGLFFEKGKMVSPRWSNIYTVELTEILHAKEERSSSAQGFLLGNSFKYGKINNFYQAKLGYGRQYIFGQKGNKNGVAVIGTAQAGLAFGLQKPYYLQINDDGTDRDIKYTPEDSALFVSGNIIGSSGFTKGWGEVKLRPGAFVKGSLRFDFGAYNESITALEIGVSVDAYAKAIEQMLFNDPKRLFMQLHVAVVFGNRK